jgi:hypothetical protein
MNPHRKSADSRGSTVRDKRVNYPYPLGLTLTPLGVNFSIFSAHATKKVAYETSWER